jgi:Tfp pilus assembly protein PilE
LTVLAIISILALIGTPIYVGQQVRAARTEAYTNLQSLRLLEEQYFAENASYVPTTGAGGPSQPGNILLIQAVLPGFQPGPPQNLNYSYQIVQNMQITTTNPLAYGALTPCFYAVATPNTGSIVVGNTFSIDCNDNKNF